VNHNHKILIIWQVDCFPQFWDCLLSNRTHKIPISEVFTFWYFFFWVMHVDYHLMAMKSGIIRNLFSWTRLYLSFIVISWIRSSCYIGISSHTYLFFCNAQFFLLNIFKERLSCWIRNNVLPYIELLSDLVRYEPQLTFRFLPALQPFLSCKQGGDASYWKSFQSQIYFFFFRWKLSIWSILLLFA